MEWNKNEWQGRSRKQVENNLKINTWTLILGIIFLLVLFLKKIS
jgi:hypothetical protein